jgi:hypothetical protein
VGSNGALEMWGGRREVPMFVCLLCIQDRHNGMEHSVFVYTEKYAGIVVGF